MGIFDKNKSISRRQLGSTLKKDTGDIPKTGGRRYSEQERQKVLGGFSMSKYGSTIDKNDLRRRMQELNREKTKTKTPGGRTNIQREIDYLKRIGGKGF